MKVELAHADDAHNNPEKREENREELHVDDERMTPEMHRGHCDSFL